MHPKYPRLFTPIRLGPVELRNRSYMSPHAVPMTVGSKPSDDYVHYNVARVKGGCSLIVLSMALHSRARIFQPATHDARNVPAFRVLTDAIYAEGGKIFGEPYYQWATHGQWSPLTPPAPAFGPSPAQYRYHEKGFTTREMTREEIGFMLDAFRQTVTNMRASGFDGVMVHAAHGALPEQFLSPYFNHRTDEYGGSLENELVSPGCASFFEGRGLAHEGLPLRHCGGASFLEGLAIDDVAFEVEVIVDVGVNRGEFL